MAKNIMQMTDLDVEKLCEDIKSEQIIVDELARLIDAECKCHFDQCPLPLYWSCRWYLT